MKRVIPVIPVNLIISIIAALLMSSFAFSQNYSINVYGGNGTSSHSGDGGPATSAGLWYPSGIAIDDSGNMYVTQNSCPSYVRLIKKNGDISTIAGNGNSVGYSGDGGQATNANLNSPYGVTVDDSGNIYIADNGNDRIRKISKNGIITTVAGNGVPGYSGDGGMATDASLFGPIDVYCDHSSNLYIADEDNNVIRKVNSGGIITTVAGNGLSGYSGDGGLATNAQLTSPWGVTIDYSGNMYVSDNDRVRKIGVNGVISTVAGGGANINDGEAATDAFLNPNRIVVDKIGNMYVTDWQDYRIRKIGVNGMISTISGNGIQGYSGDGGPATSAELNYPIGIALDNFCNVYFADNFNNRIRILENIAAINTISDNDLIKVYPNPSNGVFTVEVIPIAIGSEELRTKNKMEIYNMLGEKVYSSGFLIPIAIGTNSKFLIKLNQPAGIYLYRILSETGNSLSTGKLVIE